MNLKFEWSVGLRFLLSKRTSRTLSVNTVISTGGVTVGVAALIATLAIMTGFKEDVRDKILGANSHIMIVGMSDKGIADYEEVASKIRTVPDVINSSPYVMRQVLLSHGKKALGVVLRGVNPDRVSATTSLGDNMVVGSLNNLVTPEKKDGEEVKKAHKIIIGKEISYRLGVFIGDKINVLSPEGEISPLGIIPKMRKYEVVGIFESGMYEYDSSLVYVSLDDAQSFFNMGDYASGIEVKVKDIYKAGEVSIKIEEALGEGFLARDWQKLNKNLFSALELEKAMMFVILVLIILVASFNILGTLSMMIIEKSKEIGILKTMGATDGAIRRIFMVEGAMIGIVGTVLGIPLGISICFILQKVYSLPSDVYYIDHLPVTLNAIDILMVSFASILISLISTFYPSTLAAKTNPSEALRYE